MSKLRLRFVLWNSNIEIFELIVANKWEFIQKQVISLLWVACQLVIRLWFCEDHVYSPVYPPPASLINGQKMGAMIDWRAHSTWNAETKYSGNSTSSVFPRIMYHTMGTYTQFPTESNVMKISECIRGHSQSM